MNNRHLCKRFGVLLAVITLLAWCGGAWADPPSRVARLAYIAGAVSFSPAGQQDWSEANINRPLTSGDRLWADEQARVEIQASGATMRADGNTSLAVVNLDDRVTQLQLTQGRLQVRVRRLAANQAVEVDTPNLAFIMRQPGEYLLSVDPQADATDIIVRSGSGEAAGDGLAYIVDARQPYRFTGTGLRDYQSLAATRPDAFESWAASRDWQAERSVSARYVSPDVVGYQDLDANGSWRSDASYGDVWVPNRVADGWAPYRYGHWSWIDPWGWTWIDDAPWGFAVSHYGRWTNLRGTWGWVPGPLRAPAYYAPAVVAFVGGSNFQITLSSGNVGAVAWFALAPREIYRPSYPVSRAYFENLNRSNTVINTTVIDNSYNVTNVTNVVYANRRVAGAVTAVPHAVFVQSQPVGSAAVGLSRQVVDTAPVVAHAGFVAPQDQLAAQPVAGQPARPTTPYSRRPVATPPGAAPASAAAFLATPRAAPVEPRSPPPQATPAPARPYPPAVRAELPARAEPAQSTRRSAAAALATPAPPVAARPLRLDPVPTVRPADARPAAIERPRTHWPIAAQRRAVRPALAPSDAKAGDGDSERRKPRGKRPDDQN